MLLKESLGRNVIVAGHLVQQIFDMRIQQATALSVEQITLLMSLKLYSEHTARNIEQFWNELQTLLQPLLDQELIQKITKDGKEGCELTPKGEELLNQLWALQEKDEAEILTDFSEEEKKQLDSFLARIQQNCEKLMK